MELGRELAATAKGRAAVGEGGTFRLRPNLPSKDALEYVQQLATVALLLVALALFGYYLAASPRKALGLVLSRVGVR